MNELEAWLSAGTLPCDLRSPLACVFASYAARWAAAQSAEAKRTIEDEAARAAAHVLEVRARQLIAENATQGGREAGDGGSK